MSPPEFFETPMGRIFYEGTMPRLAKALEKLVKIGDQFMKETADAEKDDVSQFKDPYVRLAIPEDTYPTISELDLGAKNDLTIQVKLEGEGVVIDVFRDIDGENPEVVASAWKLYDEMATGEENPHFILHSKKEKDK